MQERRLKVKQTLLFQKLQPPHQDNFKSEVNWPGKDDSEENEPDNFNTGVKAIWLSSSFLQTEHTVAMNVIFDKILR